MAEDLQEKQGDIIDDGFDEFGEERGRKQGGFFTQQSNIIIIIAVVIVAGIGSYFVFKPKYSVLFSGLDTSDAAAISSYLKKENIKFKIAGDGSTILVAGTSIPRVRLDVAGKGLPKGSGVGFEVFDEKDLTVTDFGEKLKYHRALEGELARTISSLDSVKAARVHLVLPKKSVFANKEKPATASVVITPAYSKDLDAAQVKGIQHLVSSSIPGLEPDKVQITDNTGKSLVTFTSEQTLFANRLEMNEKRQREYEKRLEKDLQALLNPILGDGNVLVNVSAELNFDESEMNIERFSPTDAEGNKIDPVVRSEKVITEKYAKSSTEKLRGVPGSKSNIPNFAGVQVSELKDIGPKKDYVKEDKTVNYEISRTVEKVKKATGMIEKVSVAVVVNKDLSPSERAVLRQTVTVASGLDTERGDQVIITGIKFSSSRYIDLEEIEREKQAAEMKRKAIMKKYISLFVTLLIGGIVTVILLIMLKQGINADHSEDLDRLLDEDEVAILSDIDDKIEEAELAYSKKISLDGNKTITKMKDELQKTIDENPKAVAKSLETYINEVGV
ncbi:MAG: flagellar M-ring protein FliF [Candidatus Caenarcaniphilales bacterium]|nr:flagellar M-ring protein FliF [Candidatus Caenarcaniphilales bacterium]